MAVLAPVISPFTPDYLAPEQDVFQKLEFQEQYPAGTYLPTLVGPTTPTYSGVDGGIWYIVPSSEGYIDMKLMKSSAENASDPFDVGNISIRLDVRAVRMAAPLVSVAYVCPGVNGNGQLGERTRAGLLAVVADQTFALIDPFKYPDPGCVLFSAPLGFRPKWSGIDPLSAGEMYGIPSENRQDTLFGTVYSGPYRYFFAASDGQIILYRFKYLTNLYGLGGSDGIAEPPLQALDIAINISGEPLVYVNQGNGSYSGIVVPSDNQLVVYNLDGSPRVTLDLPVSSSPATVTAPMGYSRSMPFPAFVFVPLHGASRDSVGVLSMENNSFSTVFTPNVDGHIDIAPSPSREQALHVAYNLNAPANGIGAIIYRMSYGGVLDESFEGELPKKCAEMFYVTESTKIFVRCEDGSTYSGVATVGGGTAQGMRLLAKTGPGTKYLQAIGTLSGSKYGSMSSNEMYGSYFDTSTGAVTIFQLIGSTVAPLPPGKYASGNTYYLGTDHVGHDILTWLIYGSRIAFIVGILSAFFSVVIGTLVGLVSGYYGGIVDMLLMRVTDIVLVLPVLPIVLIWSAIWGPSIWTIIIIIAVLGWAGIARVIRAQTLSLKERPFIDAAHVGGSSDSRIILKHLAPNVLPFAFLYMTLLVAGAIITEAALSFLGLGDPKAISWGIMLSTIQTSGSTLHAWWWLLPPGIAITVLSLGFYLVGRAVDEIVNPRLRGR
ncbi:MAG: ABC transporter permease [Euryarchaeota archaeon]|nr:ABC transporter permease [Euryarchaeota archaeon]